MSDIDYKQIPLIENISPPDERDYHISKIAPMLDEFPEKFSINIPYIPMNQGRYGMCVAYSLVGAKQVQEHKERKKLIEFSPLFIYANRLESDYRDVGMYPRQALKTLLEKGVCEKSLLPELTEVPLAYDIFNNKVNQEMLDNALQYKIASYVRLYTVNEIKSALMQLNSPVAFSIPVYGTFYETGMDGIVKEPKDGLYGYHMMQITGWDDTKNSWLVLNSWGENFGDKGYCWYNYDFKIEEAWSITDYIEPQPEPQPIPEPKEEEKMLKTIVLQIDNNEAIVNGESVMLDVAPFIKDGRTMLPVRFVSEVLGATVFWDSNSKTVTIIQ